MSGLMAVRTCAVNGYRQELAGTPFALEDGQIVHYLEDGSLWLVCVIESWNHIERDLNPIASSRTPLGTFKHLFAKCIGLAPERVEQAREYVEHAATV